MNPTVVGIIAFLVMMLLIILKCPIYMAMLICSFGGLMAIASPSMVATQFVGSPFSTTANYGYAIVPLFTFLGLLTEKTGIAEGAFQAAQTWLNRSRGGLLKTVVVANGIFGACSGTPTTGTVVFSRMALPALRKSGYGDSTSLGCIASAACLASIIPPSSMIITNCMLTNNSISYSLMCGVGAGILTIVVFFLVIDGIAIFRPKEIPPREKEKTPLKLKLKALTLLIPIFALFAIIIIGSYVGFFTATVGGAFGAFVCLVYAAVKRIGWKELFKAARDAAIINAGFFPLMIAGLLFGRFVALTQIPNTLMNWILTLHAPTIVIFTVIMIFYIICGMLMDMVPVSLITVPILYPVLVGLGFNPNCIVILLVFISSMGGITPPIGLGVFMTSLTTGVDSSKIFKGVWPYFFVLLISAYLIAFIPQICTFLPDLLAR